MRTWRDFGAGESVTSLAGVEISSLYHRELREDSRGQGGGELVPASGGQEGLAARAQGQEGRPAVLHLQGGEEGTGFTT